MAKEKKKVIIKFVLRIEDTKYSELRKLADKDKRSINFKLNEIIDEKLKTK